MRTKEIRDELRRLVREVPFQPFVLNMENGERIPVDHPENIAFDPVSNDAGSGSSYFYIVSENIRYSSTFEAVTGITSLEKAETE